MAAKMNNKCARNCLCCPECGANTIIHPEEENERYRVECARCDFKYRGLEKRAFSNQIVQKDPARTDFARLLAIYRGVALTPKLGTHSDRLPGLVGLHARAKKYCRACRSVLVDPDPHPGIKYLHKTMALGMIPRFSIEPGGHLLVTNPLKIPVEIAFKSDTIQLAASMIELGPAAGTDNVSLLRQVPESCITRESPASRQVYMSGIRSKTAFGERGPNWCLVQTVADGSKTPLVLASVRYKIGHQEREINLWLRWRVAGESQASRRRFATMSK